MSDHPILEGLNPQQREAVLTVDGPLLVVAGAGTGKTRVIEHRTAWMIHQGIEPASLLLLTFTRRAANAMLDRTRRLEPRAAAVQGGTFHSFCALLLRRYHALLGLPANFVIIDQDDAADVIERTVRSLGLRDERAANFPKVTTVQRVLSHALNNRLPLKLSLETLAPDWLPVEDALEAVRAEYARLKLGRNYVDFDDLLLFAQLLLTDDEEVRRAVRARHRRLMVDEFQDTNLVQAELVKLVGGADEPESERHVMVVGDPAQSIYGFRGARFRNIMDFQRDWPGCRLVRLETNYRSTQPILDVANAVEGLMRERFARRLVARPRAEIAERPSLECLPSDVEEAHRLCDRILAHKGAGIELHRQAILVRSMYAARRIEAELLARRIPYQVFGGTALYATAHIKDLLAVLRVIENRADDVALERILRRYPGIGAARAERIMARVLGLTDDQAFLAAFAAAIRGHGPMLESLLEAFRVGVDHGRAVGDRIGAIVGLLTPVLREVPDYRDTLPERLRDLEAVVRIAAEHATIGGLLAALTLDAPTRGEAPGPAPRPDERPLALSTIHSAKGLEWEVVFIPATNHGHLPSFYALHAEDDLEEEKRVFYVAVTRARRFLHLSRPLMAPRAGGTMMAQPSPFLEDGAVRASLEERITGRPPAVEAAADGDAARKEALLRRVLGGLR